MSKNVYYLFFVYMLLILPAYAVNISWDSGGGADKNWSTATNWSSNVEPGSSDNAYISNGGTAVVTSNESVNYVCIAQNSGSSGHVEITGGSLSGVSIDPGYQGTGTITQSGGAMSVTQWLTLGWGSTGTGTYNLNGGTFTKSNTSQGITVGNDGTGIINQTGGTFNCNYWTSMGVTYSANSHGYINLSGTGVFNTAGLTVAYANTSQVTQTGGTLNQTGGSGYSLNIGNLAGVSGTYSLSGGAMNAVTLIVGESGNGTFTQTGGTSTVSANLYMGLWSGANGTYNLKGGNLSVANFGANNSASTSTFNVDGGTLSGAWATLPVDNLNIGSSASSSGSFSIGAGKTVQASTVRIGAATNAVGSLSLSGGTLSGNYVVLGSVNNSTGNVNMTGGSLNLTALDPGYYGTGTFSQSGGNLTVSEWITVGWGQGSQGTYNLSGGTLNHTATTADYGITVGYQGTGIFNHTGGTLNLGNRLGVGIHGNSNSTYNLSGTGVLNAASMILGDYGVGAFNQTGGSATISKIYIGRYTGSGTYNLQGGFLKADSIILGSGANFNFTGGTLSVKEYTGDLVVKNGATIAPGNSPGIMKLNGDITFETGSTLNIEIGGLVQGIDYDWLDIQGGNITFQPGTILRLTQWNNYTPQIGDYFDIITWDIGFNLIGLSNILFQPWDSNFSIAIYGTSLRAIYDPNLVPEVSSMALLGISLAMIGLMRLFKVKSSVKL